MLELRKNKDFWAGIMLVGIGAGAIFFSRNYHFGSALHMGPGFFPTTLGGILIVLGFSIIAVGLRSSETIQGRLSLRAFIMLPLSLLLFGILMEWAGFIPAIVVLIFVSAAAGKRYRFGQILMLSVVLTTVSAALFIWGLGLPFPLLKRF